MTTILRVFWFDLDRETCGLLLTDGSTTWATEASIEEARRWGGMRVTMREQADVVIEDGAAVVAAS